MSYQGENVPIASSQNALVELLGQWSFPSNNLTTKRRYTKAKDIEALAVSKYKRNGNGVTFDDLLLRRAANHKQQAQQTLKRCLGNNILFTMSNHKPQRYYPTCLKAEVLKHEMSKNAPIGVTEVGLSEAPLISINDCNNNKNSIPGNESLVVIQSLEVMCCHCYLQRLCISTKYSSS